MKKRNTPKLLILALIFTVVGYSQNSNYTAQTIPSELKENANAVVRNYSTEITIEDVDKMIVTSKKVVTVLNKLGNSDARIVKSYDNDTKITNLSAVIYDGLGHEIKRYKEREFLDVSAVEGGTLYSDAKVKYVNYVPNSYPYTLVFESTYKTSTTGFIPWWFPINGYYVSVQKSSYTIRNPKAISWRKKETNLTDFEVEKNTNEEALTYVLKNQKAFKYESKSVASREILPKVKVALNKFYLKGVYGEATNWSEFGKWMHHSLLKGRDIIASETQEKLLKLTKNTKDPIEKAKIVYEFMQNKTRYISVQVGIGGWEPIAADQVDKVGYGDCKGLTNYTKALLDVVGVKSYYTVVYADEKRDIDKYFSSIQGNHVILNIPTKDKDIWLECTSQINPFGFLGDFTNDRDVLVVTPEGGIIKRTVSYKDEMNLQKLKGTIQLTEKGDILASLKRVSEGLQYDDKFYLEGLEEDELKRNYSTRHWNYNNNLQVKSIKLTNNKNDIIFTEDLELSIKNFAEINGTDYLFRVNMFNKESYVPKRYRIRNLPFEIKRGYMDADSYTFKIPKSYVIENLPEKKEIHSIFGSYKVYFEKIDEATFRYEKVMIIHEGIYPKEEYKNYRNFRRSIAKHENLRIALIKK